MVVNNLKTGSAKRKSALVVSHFGFEGETFVLLVNGFCRRKPSFDNIIYTVFLFNTVDLSKTLSKTLSCHFQQDSCLTVGLKNKPHINMQFLLKA